ncbi:hypothetical protein [Novosphingobium terrae]|uniref:hypothetical protein n=1 Tax=Novosphingobium terrae TaxID=2726189 RepID=UPI00197D243F|nr:hypothetical protein [Novosphingobium terrae]
MPNVTFFMPCDAMPAGDRLTALTAQCTELCVTLLGAALDNVHVIHVPVRHGRGHPVFAQIDYRLEPFRPAPVMVCFMTALDEAILHHTGMAARIRCFGHSPTHIHARG